MFKLTHGTTRQQKSPLQSKNRLHDTRLFWNFLECFGMFLGMFWDVVECSGIFWYETVCFGMFQAFSE